jgi:predicted dehydrogenase
MKKLSVIILGAGNRGNQYAKFMALAPEQYEIVGMADPQEARRKHFQETYGVPAENCYDSWETILAQPKLADVAVISTVDNMHYIPALKAIELGYNA